jgi:hypothetical protein
MNPVRPLLNLGFLVENICTGNGLDKIKSIRITRFIRKIFMCVVNINQFTKRYILLPGEDVDMISTWSGWSSCNTVNGATCGWGKRSRRRDVPECDGVPDVQEQDCFIGNCRKKLFLFNTYLARAPPN